MTDPFKQLAWSMGEGHPLLERVNRLRDQLRELVGTNEEHRISERVLTSVQSDASINGTHARTAVIERDLRAELFAAHQKAGIEAMREVWQEFIGKKYDDTLVLELKHALTQKLILHLNGFGILSQGWVVNVYRKGDRVPPHVVLSAGGDELVKVEGGVVGADDSGVELVAIAQRDNTGRVRTRIKRIFCDPTVVALVALGFVRVGGKQVRNADEPARVAHVDPDELRSAVDGAEADLEEAMAELERG